MEKTAPDQQRSEENWDRIRKTVEERLQPIDIGSIILGNCTQEVPIIPGTLVVTYRSPHKREIAAINAMARIPGEARVDVEKLGLLNLAIGIVKLNDQEMKRVREADKINEANIQYNADVLTSLDNILLMHITMHSGWFRERVLACLDAETLKNG